MNFKQVKLKHLWRELLVLMVSLIVGSTGLQAKIQFKDAPMTITHQPTMTEPYIVVEVLYFDAEGNDSYFTTAVQETGHAGPAVYMKKTSESNYKWICSPFAELAWNTHQKTAASNIDQDGWWASTNPELPSANSGQVNTYNNNDVIIRFYNPHRRTDRESGEYYVYMYVFLKEFKVGDAYDIKIAGTWKVNEKTPSVQDKVFRTNTFTNSWSAPTAVLTGHKKITVYGDLSNIRLNGSTTVGLYSSSSSCPSEYISNLGASKTFGKTETKYSKGEGPECSFTFSYNFKSGSYIPVQYSYPYDFSLDNWSPSFSGQKPVVYSWFRVSFTGFSYPVIDQAYEVSNPWEKKVKIKWNAVESATRSKAGKWMIKNHTTGNTVEFNDYSTREGEIAINEYSTDKEVKSDSITVYFIPKDYTGDPISSLSVGTNASITPIWDFTNFKASVISEGDDAGKIILNWKHNAFGDASSSKKYTIQIFRSIDNENYTKVASSEVDNNTTTDGSYIDNPGEAGKTYYYKLKVENLMGKTVTSEMKSARSGASSITSFTATRGSYSNMVKLQWNIHLVGNSANFIIQRCPLSSSNDDDWADIYATSGTTTSYSYDDVTALPGSFNNYRLVIWTEETIGGKTVRSIEDSETCDGFSISTGIVSGNVSYGTGTAVEGVKVTLKQQVSDGDIASGMHSLNLFDAGAGVQYATSANGLKSLFDGDFSIQMYLSPNSGAMSTDNSEYQLFHIADVLDVKLKYNASAAKYTLAGNIGGSSITSTTSIPAGTWSHLTLTYSKSSKELKVYVTKEETANSEVVATVSAETIWPNSVTSDLLTIGNTDAFNSSNCFAGYIDEFRLWTKTLTELEITHNYNHPLAGKESDLAIYYPFDEGIEKQSIAYDFSKKNGVSNGRHGYMNVTAASTEVLPSENELSLMAYTDANGYYEIRGVPFSGEGTSYSVIPTMGIHEFTPAAKSRYVSISTLNHSGVDFEDVSSFPVSGTIFYANTDYPVEGVNFFVDGNICSKDGEIITTNDKGEFTISVPIGDHFITVQKNGHKFTNVGRYPSDPNNVGTKHTFDREIKNLEFIDETLVNFTGRVVGGDIEGGKTIGFRKSNNNIGVAELILSPSNTLPRMNVVKEVNNGTYSYEVNQDILDIASATDLIESRSWRGAGQMYCRKIFIQTDPTTGEFSAMLPPLVYAIESIKLVNDPDHTNVGDPMTLDLSNPMLESSDTLHTEDGDVLYTYHTALKQAFHSIPTFIVTQKDHEDATTHVNDGAFGIKSYEMEDAVGKLTVNDIYSIVNGSPVYKYGGAVFVMNDRYTFNIEAYEEYENVDVTPRVTDHVPLANIVVTINNALSNEQAIAAQDGMYEGKTVKEGQIVDLKSNQLMLDDEGKATYSWIAGMPNIVEPYTRTLSITYDIGDRTYPWSGNGMNGVVLGSLPTGNNFVTAGPDVVDMILRDPPGSGSSAEWTSGTISSFTRAKMGMESVEAHVKTTAMLGSYAETATGFGVYMINTLESKVNIEGTLSATEEFEGGDTFSRTIEITKTISTSEEEDYVGAQGDVFIGQSTNVIFGAARNIDFHRVSAESTEVELQLDNVITTGLSFGTMFNYTQMYIEEDLIPNLEKMRNGYLQTVTPERLATYVNEGDEPVYLTTLSPDDPRFGSDNNDADVWGADATSGVSSQGPSYKMILPQTVGDESFTDQVLWCNNQIDSWIGYLELNEREKVEAYEHRNDKTVVTKSKNYSFDSGSKVTDSYDKEEGDGFKYTVRVGASVEANVSTGGAFNHLGLFVEVGGSAAAGYVHEHEESDLDKIAFSYTLAESGTYDALTVDVYEYGDYGPIFRTLGGQTSAPYEGKEVTKYYKPGTTIMDATMQVEVPQIYVDVPEMSDIPTGSAANYTLHLGNASEVNKDVTYKLFVLDGTNPDGALISVDGQVLTEGRLINVQAGQTIAKSLQLRQTQQDILDYFGNKMPDDELFDKGIGIVFASESQPEDIADTVFIKARFTPSSSPVSLALSNSIMNTETGTDLTLTFKDFDRNYKNLKAFRLQYKMQGATDWRVLKEYVMSNPSNNQIQMPSTGSSVSYKQPMSSYSDGEYMFRVVSVSSYGDGEVCRYSEELTLVKDMQRPTPLGQPEPSDGILNIGDDLSVSFNETILKGELTKTANFKVTGVLNGQPVAHWTALSMQNTSATASTEANINLAGKDFAFDAWINLAAGAGTLLSHGNGTSRMSVGIDADQKLVVTISGQTYTSTNAVPTGKWAFLTLSYKNTASGSLLNASVADDANTTNLFVDKAVAGYKGNGKLTVGTGMTGSIHELLLWDEAHDMTTALLNRSKTKNPSTRHLIGYWKMDEGEGTTIRDYSRNRHMTMSDATWYLNNDNKSVVLDGSHYLKIDASCLPVCVDDDYAVEFWMRGAAQSDAQLLQMGEISLWVKADGTLQLTGKGAYNDAVAVTFATNATNLTDNAWHHIAVNVLRQGAAAVYVDGVRCLTTSSTNVGGINTNSVFIGVRRITESAETGTYSYDREFTGMVDEVRVWNATMNSDMLLKNRRVRLTGTEDGLIAYYPFEKQTLDDGNQIISVGSDVDLTDSLIVELMAVSNHQSSDIAYSNEAPAMRQKPVETNVSFTFVASNEKVVINIDEDPAIIEGCTLNFTVRDLRDENGNYSVPAVWSAFVNRKELAWDEDELSVKQEVKDESSITATIVNKSGAQQMWTLSGMPSWLTASSEYGTTNPLAQSKVTFTVSPATPIGKYQETIYLKSNNGIETPLTLNVTVTGQVPEWSINSKDYEMSMNVIGRVMVQGVPMDDTDDIVAAFIGEECRGIAHPVYSSRYDSYFVTIDIYGTSEEHNMDDPVSVTFRAYDASTGTLYPEVEAGSAITFEALTLEGSYANPVVLTALNKIEQSTDLKKGWNWLSFFVTTDNRSVQSLFAKIADDVEVIKSQTQWLMNEGGNWAGNLTGSLTNDQMYTVKLKNDRTLRLVGQPVNPSSTAVTLRNGWNWIGYYGRQVADITDALAGMIPKDGEILKGQNGVAYYDQYEWAGSLVMLEPGTGYMIQASTSREFSYPGSTVSLAPRRGQTRGSEDNNGNESFMFHAVDFRNYSGNAIMSAKIMEGGTPVANAEFAIFADGECRAVAMTNDKGVAYLTIPGDDAATLTFKAVVGARVFDFSESLVYETDEVYGTPKNPIVFTLGDDPTKVTAIDVDQEGKAVYDLQGRKIEQTSGIENGIFIINGQKRTIK